MSNVTLKKLVTKLADSLYKQTNFTKGECESLLRMYYQLVPSHDSKMDRTKFRDILHNTFNMTDDILLDRVFRAFDRDMDSHISPEEWVKGLSVFLRGNLDELTEFSFQVYDLNSSGSITREAMYQLLKSTLIKETDQPTEEDPDEGVRELVELTFKKLDVDHDGRLSFNDFRQAVAEEPLMLEGLGKCLPDQSASAAFQFTFAEIKWLNTICYLTKKSEEQQGGSS